MQLLRKALTHACRCSQLAVLCPQLNGHAIFWPGMRHRAARALLRRLTVQQPAWLLVHRHSMLVSLHADALCAVQTFWGGSYTIIDSEVRLLHGHVVSEQSAVCAMPCLPMLCITPGQHHKSLQIMLRML